MITEGGSAEKGGREGLCVIRDVVRFFSGNRDALKLLSFLCLAVVPGTRKFITGSGFKVLGSRFWVLGSGKATKIRLTSSTDR